MQLGAISALITENFNAENLIGDYYNMPIRAAKSIVEEVIDIEALERWQRQKLYEILLAQYLRNRKMKLLQ